MTEQYGKSIMKKNESLFTKITYFPLFPIVFLNCYIFYFPKPKYIYSKKKNQHFDFIHLSKTEPERNISKDIKTNDILLLMRVSDKHQKITQAAVKVFARKGFFNARISDIAKEAKVADGTIYLYFNNKYDILISLFEDEIGKIIVKVKLLLENETDPVKMLEIYAIHHLSLLDDQKELVEVLQMELRQSNKFIKEYRNTKFIEYIDIVSDIVHKGQESGHFRKEVMPGIVKRAFFGALDEMSRLWSLSAKPHYSLEETAKQISDIFLHGLITRSN